MFRRYLAYSQYREAVVSFGKREGYTMKDIHFQYPWSRTEVFNKPLVAIFDSEICLADPNYRLLYRTNHIRFYEKKSSIALRHGITKKLQHRLLTFVRQSAESTLLKGGLVTDLLLSVEQKEQVLLHEITTVDVTVWVEGILRGSIVRNGELKDALQQATLDVIQDKRFKPLTLSELEGAVFEVVVIPNVWMPLTYLEHNDLVVNHENATRMISRNKVRSWYMTNLGNQVNLGNTKEYLSTLAIKGGISKNSVRFESARAFSCVELKNKPQPLLLLGTVPFSNNKNDLEIQNVAKNIADSIDSDGYCCVLQKVADNNSLSLDLARQAFCTLALAEYQVCSRDMSFAESIAKSSVFITKNLHLVKSVGSQEYLTRSYLAQLFIYTSLESNKDFFINSEAKSVIMEDRMLSPLVTIQLLKTLIFSDYSEINLNFCREQTQILFDKWQNNKKRSNPVAYADLLFLLRIANLQDAFNEFYFWLESFKNEDGSFKLTPLPYVKGVAKLAEATASFSETQALSNSALEWLSNMQYQEGTMYHIPLAKRDRFNGGFRHNYWDRDLWIDGSAHVLCTMTRVLYHSNYKSHLQKYLQE